MDELDELNELDELGEVGGLDEVDPLDKLTVLQTIRLKGRVDPEVLADSLETGPGTPDDAADGSSGGVAAVGEVIERLVAAGLVARDPVRLTDAGRRHCEELLAAERAGADAAALAAAYQAFRPVDAELKALVTDWQLRREHVTTRLDAVHLRVTAIIGDVTRQLPRLAGYHRRLDRALRRIHAGDPTWLTRPLADSYHTVWFELHEELLQACGLSRADIDHTPPPPPV